MSEKLLKLRKRIKSKKPKFVRQDAHKMVEVSNNWRRPKGLQSKMRLNKKGYRKCVTPGYGSPKKVKFLHPSGLQIVLVFSVSDLKDLDPKIHGTLISSTVGLKKKLAIINKAKELSITLLNIKDPEKFVKDVNDAFEKKKQKKKAKQESKSKKKVVAKPKEKKLESLTEEEKKDAEKKEKDKLLIQRK